MDTITGTLTEDNLVAGDFPLVKDNEQTLLLGEDLERGSVLGKLTALAATKDSGVGPFAMEAADTMVIDVDDAGNETCTFDAVAGYVEDVTTTYPCADQDGLTTIISVDGGDPQTVTIAGTVTALADILEQMNAQLIGCRAINNGSDQPRIVSDSKGTGSTISNPTGTSLFVSASAAPVDGTGDVVDILAVTATEAKTVIEADSTAEVTVNADGSFTISSPTEGTGSELDFKSGNALAIFGFSVEVITPATGDYGKLKLLDKDANDGSEVPYGILAEDCDASGAAKNCVIFVSGQFTEGSLVFASGTVVADVKTAMRNVSLYTKPASTL